MIQRIDQSTGEVHHYHYFPDVDLKELVKLLLMTRATLPQEFCVQTSSTAAAEPVQATAKAVPPSQCRQRPLSVWVAWRKYGIKDAKIECRPSTVTGYTSGIRHFCQWFRRINPRSRTPGVDSLESDPSLLSQYYAHCLESLEISTCNTKLDAVERLWESLLSRNLIGLPCPKVSRAKICKQRGKKAVHYTPIPMSLPDLGRLAKGFRQKSWRKTSAAKVFSVMDPADFYVSVIGTGAFLGINPGDIWGIKPDHHGGLKWSEVHLYPEPPFFGSDQIAGASWEHGWLDLTRNKTGNPMVVPIPPGLRHAIDLCRGLDPESVFPLGNDFKTSWYRAFREAKEHAGLYWTPKELKEALAKRNSAVYDISMSGQSPSRSLRKTAAVLWKKFGNSSQASHVLAHATRSGRVSQDDFDVTKDVASAITEKHYAGSQIYVDLCVTSRLVWAEIAQHLAPA